MKDRKRPTSRSRGATIGLAASTSLFAVTPAVAQQSAPINIPAQSAPDAITNLARQTRTQILFDHDQLQRVRSRPVNGKVSPQQALQIMLAGSGFQVARTPSGALIIRPVGAEGGSQGKASPQDANGAEPPGNNQAIVVVGIRSAIEKSLEVKRRANSMVDSISAEDVGKLPDHNIAEAVQRVPGVSIDREGGEGRHISVNGLGPEFVLTLLNGRQIATSDEGRSFSFDTIASSLVSRIDVYKTTNVDMPEGGLGGTIDVHTPRPFDFPGFTASAQAAYQYNGLGKAGYPQGSLLVSDRFLNGKLGILVSFSHQKRHTTTYGTNAGGWSTNYFVDPVSEAYVEDAHDNAWRSWNLAYTRTEDYRERNGGTAVIQFAPIDGLTLTADYLNSKFTVTDVSDQGGAYLWAVQDTAKTVLTDHGLKQLDVGLPPSTCVYPWDGIPNSPTNGVHDCLGSYSFTHTSSIRPTTTQLAGLNVEWKPASNFSGMFDGYWSKAVNNNTGQNTSANSEMTHMPEYLVIFPNDGSAPSFNLQGVDLAHAADKLRPRGIVDSGTYSKGVNKGLNADFDWAPASFLRLKFGAGYADQVKDNTFYTTPGPISRIYWGFSTDAPPDPSVLDGVLEAGSQFGVSGDPFPIFLIDPAKYAVWEADPTNLATHIDCPATSADHCGIDEFIANGRTFNAVQSHSSYRIEEKDLNIYGELDARFRAGGVPVTVIAGLRYSRTHLISAGTNRILIGFDGNAANELHPIYQDETNPANPVYVPVTVENTYAYWLPSLNVGVELTPKTIARIGLSRTMTRPTLDEISPSESFGGFGFTESHRTGSAQNPNLKPFTSNNIDASLEYYYSHRGAIVIAGFHKNARNFILSNIQTEVVPTISFIRNIFNPDGSPSPLTLTDVQHFQISRPYNAASTVIDGLTVSWTHSCPFGLGFQANYTKVWSKAKSDLPGRTFNVPGISDTANLIAFYEKGPISARIAFNWRSAYVVSAGDSGSLPVTGAPYHQIDARLGYALGRGIDVAVEANNITNERVRQYAQYPDQFVSETGFGRELTATISKKF